MQWLSLLKRPLRLKRKGLSLQVEVGDSGDGHSGAGLASSPSGAASSGFDSDHAAVAAGPGQDGRTLRLCHRELRDLLRQDREARHDMRHLSYFESTLGRSGSRALRSDVPLPVLRKALEQLEQLARKYPSALLEQLQVRMADTILERDRARMLVEEAAAGEAMEVSEATHSLFDEMERSWVGQFPTPAQAQAARDSTMSAF